MVPHFEKMSYDNSELLKNYVHAYQATGVPFFAAVARDMIRWMDEWLSDRENGGFYGSQDADYSMEDDGDYFTWTLDEARAVLSPDELKVAAAYYDIGEVGEMHHNPAKNVLWVKSSVEQIAVSNGMSVDRASALLDSAKQKIVCGAAEAADSLYRQDGVRELECAVHFRLPASRTGAGTGGRARVRAASLDRILSEAWESRAKG